MIRSEEILCHSHSWQVKEILCSAQLYLKQYYNQLSFNCFKRMTNFNGRKQLICLCLQHNVRGQARQEKPKTIPRTNPEQLNQRPKDKAPYSRHNIYTSKCIGLELALELMRALWLLLKKRIWIMLFYTQMFAARSFLLSFINISLNAYVAE